MSTSIVWRYLSIHTLYRDCIFFLYTATVKKEKDNPLATKKEEVTVTKSVSHPSMAMPVVTLVPTTVAITKHQTPPKIKSGPVTVPKAIATSAAARTIPSAPSSKGALTAGSVAKVPPQASTGGKAVRFGPVSLTGEKIVAGPSPAGSLRIVTSESAIQAAGQLKQSILKGTVAGATAAGSGNRVSEMMLVQQMNPEAKSNSGTKTSASVLMTQDTLSAMLIPQLLQTQIPSLQISSSTTTGSTASSGQLQMHSALSKITQTNKHVLSQPAQGKHDGKLGTLATSKPALGSSTTAATIKTGPVVQLKKVSAAPPPPSIVKHPTAPPPPTFVATNSQVSLRQAPPTQQVATTQTHSPTLHYTPTKFTVASQVPHRTPSPLSVVNKPSTSQVAANQSVIMAARPSGIISAVTSSNPSLSILASTSSHSSQSKHTQVKSPMEQILKEHSYDSHQPIFGTTAAATTAPTLQLIGASPVVHTANPGQELSYPLLMLAQSSNTTAPTISASTSNTNTVGHGRNYPIANSSAGSQQSGMYLNLSPAAKLKMPAPP